MKLVFLGPPGAGKGTQAARIASELHIAHISTGDMLRAEMRTGTPLGKAAKGYIDRGELVPDDVILGMVGERIKCDDCANGFLFDGFPRTIAQAEALEQICDIDRVINIDVPGERIVERISGRRMCDQCGAAYHVSTYTRSDCDCGGKLYQRDDDKRETVENRLRVYVAQTQPLIDFYDGRGLLSCVDGDDAIDTVCARIREALSL